jgi:hypothetical protein
VIDMKKILVSVVVVAIVLIAVAAVALAAVDARTPAEIVAGLTGKSVDEVTAAREDGQTYGAQAAAAGQLESFQTARLEQYKLRLDEAVKNGQITQTRADELYAAMKTRIEACEGDGSGLGNGARGGLGMGLGQGQGQGARAGLGQGNGRGRMGGGCGLPVR